MHATEEPEIGVEVEILGQIKRHMKVRDGKDLAAALDPVKERILTKRNASDKTDTEIPEIDEIGLGLAADKLSQSLLTGAKVLLVGRANPDHILAISTLIRGMRLLTRSLQRTRDVIQTRSGSFSECVERFEIDYFCLTFTSDNLERRSHLDNKLSQYNPDVIVTLDPTCGVLPRLKECMPTATLITLTTHGRQRILFPCDISVFPGIVDQNEINPKKYTLSSLAAMLVIRCREKITEQISGHARAQALSSQLNSAGLEASDTYVALSYLCDDMPMESHVRVAVSAGVDRVNRGWAQQPRTSHSRGNLHYGLRALLIESEAVYPFTAQELQMRLIPLFSSVCFSGSPDTLIDCLLCCERKISSEKASKASILKAKTYFPTLKQLAGLIGAEQGLPSRKMAQSEKNIEYEESQFDTDSRLLPVFAERRYAESGRTQLVRSDLKSGLLRCFIRSDYVNVNDMLRFISFEMSDDFPTFQFWADAFSGDVVLGTRAFGAFRSKLEDFLDKTAEYADLSSPTIIDGRLNINQRTSAFAQWIEKQPWGRRYPEPIFEQCFIVRSSTTIMETHQQILVNDCDVNGRALEGEGLVLLWRNSVAPLSEKLSAGQRIIARYRLRVKRDKTCTDVFGEIVRLSLSENGAAL